MISVRIVNEHGNTIHELEVFALKVSKLLLNYRMEYKRMELGNGQILFNFDRA